MTANVKTTTKLPIETAHVSTTRIQNRCQKSDCMSEHYMELSANAAGDQTTSSTDNIMTLKQLSQIH